MKHQLLARYPVGNPNRIWKQEHFILHAPSPGPMISSKLYTGERGARVYRKTRRAVKTTMDAGFTMMGCLWADSRMAMDIVRTAETHGGSVLFQDLWRFGGTGHNPVLFETNDYENVVRETRNWKCIKGYCMWDEPIPEDQMLETRRMIDWCEKEYPEVLPYTVANPDGHLLCRDYVSYIRKFVELIDPAQLGFDYYPIGKPEYDPARQLDNSSIWRCLEVVRREAAKKGLPMWFAYQGHRYHFHKQYYSFHFAMARSMAHAGILHGAKALECYTEFDGYVDPATGGPGPFFEEQKKLNTELRTLGNTLMALKCLRVIHDDTLLPDNPVMEGLRTSMEESELLTGKLLPRISVSEHEDPHGNKYLMVLNRDYEKLAHIQLLLKQPSHIYEVSKEDGEQYLRYEDAGDLAMYLEPGDLKLYRIQPSCEEPFTVEYYLEKD